MNNEIVVPSVKNTSISIYNSQTASTKESSCDWHFHEEIELFLLYEGSKSFYFENQVVELEKDSLIFVNRRTPHKTYTPVGSRGMLLQFDDEFSFEHPHLNKYVFSVLKNKEVDFCIFPADTAINAKLRECLRKISFEYANKDKFFNMYIQSYVCEILACLYRNDILVTPDELINKKLIFEILPVLDYISEHYAEHISLNEVCDLMHVEKSYFCKLFKKSTNMTFLNYLNFIRIRHAETLLRERRKSITEIALQTGFSSTSYFTETFRKINLLTPTTYRKMSFVRE